MLGEIGLFEAELSEQRSRSTLPVAERFNDGNPRGVCKCLKDLCLELSQCLHMLIICENANMRKR